eukprot:15327333-Ditylum_brightwellii.AAC.1
MLWSGPELSSAFQNISPAILSTSAISAVCRGMEEPVLLLTLLLPLCPGSASLDEMLLCTCSFCGDNLVDYIIRYGGAACLST